MNKFKNKIKHVLKFDAHLAQQTENKMRGSNFLPINETKPQDIFIAGFPKSGNTWLQNLIAGILLDSTSALMTQKLVNELVPDVHARSYYKRFFNTMVFKTHDLPKPQYKKVIHLVRDGRDAMVSYYKMGVNKNVDFPYSMEDMVVKGKGVSPSKWNFHTREWLNNPHKAEVITVKYEDLKSQPLEALQRICDFMEVEITNDRLERIIDHNAIDNLRERVSKFGMDNDHTWKNKPVTSFFRKGQVGGYKEEMDEELVALFNEESKTELEYFNYL